MGVVNIACLAIIGAALVASSQGQQQQQQQGVASPAEDFTAAGWRTAFRIYDECHRSVGGLSPCLKKKAITFVDRASRLDKINLGEGVYVIRSSAQAQPSIVGDENELENSLPRSAEAKEEALTRMLLERVENFFNTRTLQVTLPKIDSQELGRSIEEGRGKMKKMMGMMMMGAMMKMAAMVPMAIAGLYMLAGKALIVSKIALLLSGIIALKKLMSQKGGGGGGHESHGWSSGGGGGGGWDRRSIAAQAEAQKLAYNSYHP